MVDNIIRFQSDLYEISDTIDLIYKQMEEKSIDLEIRLDKAYKFVESLDWKDIAKTFAEDIKRLS